MRRPLFRILALVLLSLALGAEPIQAASESDALKKTLYGMFRQTAEGAINFIDAQEAGVVYIPFDAKAIMSDVLNIEVQVQGSIVESFTRNGASYRIIAVDSIKPMTAEYGATTVTAGQHPGLPGTDAAQVHAYHNKTCYLYDRYAVLDRLAAYSDGHDLRVMARTAADAPAAVCESLEGTPLFEIPNGGDFTFAGLSGDTMFIQNGPPDAVHGLMAVNLAAQKQTLDANVVPGASVAKGVLRYPEIVAAGKDKPICPAGKTAVREMTLELKSGKRAAAGKVACR